MSNSIKTITGNVIRKPYHALGKLVKDYSAACAAVGFSLVSKPVNNPFTGEPIPNEVGVYRNDSFACLGIHSDGYTYIQPNESLSVLEAARSELVKAGYAAEWSSVRVGHGGSSLSAFVTLDTTIVAPRRGDKVGLSVALHDNWSGKAKNTLQLLANVLACDNGMTREQSLCDFGAKHNPCIADRMRVFQGSLAMNLQLQIQGMTEDIARLDNTLMAQSEVEPFARALLGVDLTAKPEDIATQTQTKLDAIVAGFTRGRGNVGRTRWDAFNAVTEYIDHAANYRASEGNSVEDNRFASLVSTSGGGTKLRARAMELLLN